MKNRAIQVSIVTVNYRVEKELIGCIESIINSKPKVSYEIIVVDNDEKKTLEIVLKKKFPQVKYVKSLGNIGFGGGNNLGEKISKGEYIFFLNPDTTVTSDSIDTLYNFTKKNKDAGMVAPLLLTPLGKEYPYQGSDMYTLKNSVFVLSFLNKLLPNNPMSRKFFHKDWNRKNIEEFDVVPGTAFMIKKEIFDTVKKFDENLFLYFEEYDLAKRVRKLEYKNYIIPQSKVFHVWEASTKKKDDIAKIFIKSRFFFFKKNYGIATAILIEFFSCIGKYEFLLCLILALSVFLSLFKLGELMTFIGDQAWFYISARDMFINADIPLVGIASSRPWLHQGPFWTYLLAIPLWLFNFNPLSGAFITVLFGLLSIIGIYMFGSVFFSKKIGLISALLYTTSPLVVFYNRLPYHTSVIPFFVILFLFSLYKIMQNKIAYLPFTLLLISILYNFEIATIILAIILIGVLGYKLFKKEIQLRKILNFKMLVLSVISILFPLVPMILYDMQNGFPQTFKFIAWVFYRVFFFFNFYHEHGISFKKLSIMIIFFQDNLRKLIFAQSNILSITIFIVCITWVIYLSIKRKTNYSLKLLFIMFIIPLILIFLNQTPSDAYLPILFPTVILIIAIVINYILHINKMTIPAIIFLSFLASGNVYFMIKNNFSFDEASGKILTLNKRIESSKKILKAVGSSEYNLIGKGPGSKYNSFTVNYEYLTWWLGHAPSKSRENVRIYISESEKEIKIEKND